MTPIDALNLLSSLVWPLLFVAVVAGCILGIRDRLREGNK